MPMPTPQQAADNWASGMASAGQRMEAGVRAVNESPMEKAAAAVDRQVQGVMLAAQEGRTQAALRRVSLETWKQLMITKGVPRIGAGANAAKPKMAAFMAEFLPVVASAVAQLPPRGDFESNMRRQDQLARALHQFRRRG